MVLDLPRITLYQLGYHTLDEHYLGVPFISDSSAVFSVVFRAKQNVWRYTSMRSARCCGFGMLGIMTMFIFTYFDGSLLTEHSDSCKSAWNCRNEIRRSQFSLVQFQNVRICTLLDYKSQFIVQGLSE
jgi:hypothetical protein